MTALDTIRAARLLRTRRLGRPLMVLASTGSTNEVARRLAVHGAPAGLVVLAREQTKGRGRHGRRWHSPAGGGLYLSALLRPALTPAEATRLVFVAAVAAAEALRTCGGLPEAAIEWPNDLVTADGLKLGGILAESRAAGDGRLEWVVLGLGLNLARGGLPADVAKRSSSVHAEGGLAEAEAILAAFLERLEQGLARLERGDWAGVLGRWRELAVGLEGRPSRYRRDDGTELEGWTAGVDDKGALRLRLPDRREELLLVGDRVAGLD